MIEYPTKVLLATDGSEDSVRAAHAAVALAANAGAELHLVHVGRAASSSAAAGGTRPPLPGEPPGYAERQARLLLDRQAEVVHEAGGSITGTHVRMGEPSSEIISLAAELGADLVVAGSGGPRTVRRAVAATTRRPATGGTSDAVVRGAHCPVLVVRGEVNGSP